MSGESVVVSIRRATRVSDESGGKTESWNEVASGLLAQKRLYSQKSLWREEGGPGVRTETRQLFVLYGRPFPDARVNDVIREADGTEYRLLFARRYARSLQLDTRRMT
jgi:hypothetical protein